MADERMNNLLAGRRILVVEDEVMISWMLENTLTTFGCVIVGPAARLNQALEIASTTADIDAAVLDINLDGEKSYPVADALAARGVPFVFSTAYQRDRLQDGYKTCPMIQKPYHSSTLREALIQILSHKESAERTVSQHEGSPHDPDNLHPNTVHPNSPPSP